MIDHDNLSKLLVILGTITNNFQVSLKNIVRCLLDNIMLKIFLSSSWIFVTQNAGKPVYAAFLTVINYFFGEKS